MAGSEPRARAAGVHSCLVSPNAGDTALTLELLAEHGIVARAFSDLRELAYVLDETMACLIIVEEALLDDDLPALREALGRLPAWSDLPLILIARDVTMLGVAAAREFPSSGNVTLLERPLNPHTLISAVQVAVRAALRQRQVGELIAERDQAVQLRDEFLAMLAHELRNPLTPMLNAVYMMRAVKVDDPVLLKTTEILERQVTHVARMVDDLMDVARLERGKVSLKKQRVDLSRAAESAMQGCTEAAAAQRQSLKGDYAGEPLPLDADPVRLDQVVSNLLQNAIKFSPPGSEITARTSAEGPFAVLAVEDSGIGFLPGLRDKLFDPFLQLNPTLERAAGGLGMGLTIVKRLVDLHGGSVSAESEGPGKGSRFIVKLPLGLQEAHPLPRPVGETLPARPRRIVVVDDNPDIRESVRMLVTLWGHDITMAADGPSGLELVLRERPDIALIDIGLPGMNGYDLARQIRSALPNRVPRLIAVTGYGQPSDRELALEAGFDAHLLKPIAPEALQQLLT